MSAEADVSVSKNSPHARQHALLGMAMQGHGSRRDRFEGTETIVLSLGAVTHHFR